jgi:hypothetical protein
MDQRMLTQISKTTSMSPKNNGHNKHKAVFDLEASLLQIRNGVGQGLVAKVLKKDIDY